MESVTLPGQTIALSERNRLEHLLRDQPATFLIIVTCLAKRKESHRIGLGLKGGMDIDQRKPYASYDCQNPLTIFVGNLWASIALPFWQENEVECPPTC